MAKNIQIKYLFVFALLTIQGALAADGANLFGPSTADQYANADCGASALCPLTNYTKGIDLSTILADNVNTLASSGIIRNATGANAQIFVAGWYVDATYTVGNFSLKVWSNTQPTTLVIIPMANETHVNTNTSFWTTRTLTSNVLTDIDVDLGARASFASLGYIAFKFFVTDISNEQIGEVYLEVPPIATDFNFVPSGESIVRLDSFTAHDWTLFTAVSKQLMSNVSCSVYDINNQTQMISGVSTITTGPNQLRIKYLVNSSLGFVAGRNYESRCSLNIGSVRINDISQYAYVTSESSILTSLASIISSIGQLLGLYREPVVVDVIPEFVSSQTTTNVVVGLTRGSSAISSNSSICRISVFDVAGLTVVNNQSMSSFGVSAIGMFNFSMNTTLGSGAPYAVRSVCSVNDSGGQVNSYLGTGTLNALSSASINVSQIFEGTPSVKLVSNEIASSSNGRIMAQVLKGSTGVSDAFCSLTIYFPNNSTKLVNSVSMSYFGEAGLYNYSLVAPVSYGIDIYPSRINCTSGLQLGSQVVQTIEPVRVVGGVVMQSVS